MALVILLVDDVEIRKYPIGTERLLIGRSSKAQSNIDDTTVSGKHAVLEGVKEKDRCHYYIQDLNSTKYPRGW